MNNKKITILFIGIACLLLVGIGLTMAYFTSSTDFENEFNTALYQTEATETFTSPQNWMPGDETPKTLTITNTGDVDVKARVCISEVWESANGDTLPNEQNGERVAILNLDNTSDWTYRLGCYEYNDVLEPNDTTSSFIESVTFNPLIESDIECTTTTNNGTTTKTCNSTGDGYDNATYTLTLTVETIQESAYETLWPNPITYVNRQVEGQITTGDELAIDTEHFYVVSSNQNETVLLAKYNLLVGNIYEVDSYADAVLLKKELNSSDTGYGLQSSTALAFPGVDGDWVGIVAFSGTNYWDNSVCEYSGTSGNCTGTTGLLPEYSQNGEDYNGSGGTRPYVYRSNVGNNIAPVYNYNNGWGAVQNNGYTIAYYVENYVNTLKLLGAPSTIAGRLLSYEEANTIITGNTNPLKEHLYDSTYWLGSAGSYDSMYSIKINDGIDQFIIFYENEYYNGVRPVIVVNTSDL